MSRTTHLHSILAEHRATFRTQGGWEIADRFGDPLVEYRAVRQKAGVADLSHRGRLAVRGADRIGFLQGMVSNDVKNLPAGRGCHAAQLTPQGKVRTDLWIYPHGDALRIDVHPERRDLLVEILEKHIISEDVQVVDVSDELGLLTLQGPEAASILKQVFPDELPAEEYGQTQTGTDRQPVRLVRRTGYTGEEGFEILALVDRIADLWIRIVEAGARPIGAAALEILRVEAGIPLPGKDMDEGTLALEAPLESAIHLDKGCYIGQEFVARITHRGHVNRKFTGIRLEEPPVPEPGTALLAGDREVGRITSAVLSPHLRCPIAVGYLRTEHGEPGTAITVDNPAGRRAAKVVRLPFYRREPSGA